MIVYFILYYDISIDYNTLNLLPADSSIFYELYIYNLDNINNEEEESGLDKEPAQSISRLLPNKEYIYIYI